MVEQLKAQISKNAEEIKRYNKEMFKASRYSKSLERELGGLRNMQKVAQKVYNVVKKPLDKLPKVPVKMNKPTIGSITKVGGKLIGGFGVFVEILSLCDDINAAVDDVNNWADLLEAILNRIPCEGNEEAALICVTISMPMVATSSATILAF